MAAKGAKFLQSCGGLENRRWETIREFESHRFRHIQSLDLSGLFHFWAAVLAVRCRQFPARCSETFRNAFRNPDYFEGLAMAPRRT